MIMGSLLTPHTHRNVSDPPLIMVAGRRPGLAAGGAAGQLAEDVEVAVVAGGFLDEVEQDPPERDRLVPEAQRASGEGPRGPGGAATGLPVIPVVPTQGSQASSHSHHRACTGRARPGDLMVIMSGASGLVVPAFAALAAACAFGVAAALQHRQAGLAPGRGLSLRLLADVARRPLWLAGLALATMAYGLQAVALAFGPLTLVAPIVAADLLFALPLAARWSRRPLRPRDWAGCLLVAAGVAVFLAVAPPSAGRAAVPAGGWVVAFGIVVVITALAVGLGRVTGRVTRAGLLAAAAGVVFGLTAAVTASFVRSLRQEGVGSILAHWQPWALITLGIAGIALSTGAFQASTLSASLPIIDTVEPVSGVVIGAFLFDERLAASPAGLLVQLAAAGVAVAGIVMLGPALAAASARPGRERPARSRPELAGPYRIRLRGGGCDVLEAGHPATTAEARPEPERADRLRSTSCP
jgi:drug/metabolite transporter (DMT)-like permease